jgi:sialic acid synthase SpsE
MRLKIGDTFVGDGAPFYTIAEIGSNFDGDIDRAKMLVDLAKDSGADAVKFQTFTAKGLVSEEGFRNLKVGYQANWKVSVTEMYSRAEFPRQWHKELFNYARSRDLAFLSSAYDKEGVDLLEDLDVPAYKIGSGDLTWLEMVEYIARKAKPVIVATGASTLEEVDQAIATIKKAGNDQIIILQCVTNYPSSFENINLRVLDLFRQRYGALVGYSDHTPGSMVAIGTVALGGCMIEKHFTDDKTRNGPDHPFAMDGGDFRRMVDDIRLMEKMLGKPVREVYEEEKAQYVSMKRGIRASRDIAVGIPIAREMIEVLRPCGPRDFKASEISIVVGRVATRDIEKGEALRRDDIE